LGKAPDLLLRVDVARHEAFLIALTEYGIAFNGNDVTIPHNTLLGIEVECATDDSNLTRSITNNLTKDRAAGLTHIIFAVMPKTLARAKKYLASCDHTDGVILIDALKLLDHLRKGTAHG
jgi:hypothetical protein